MRGIINKEVLLDEWLEVSAIPVPHIHAKVAPDLLEIHAVSQPQPHEKRLFQALVLRQPLQFPSPASAVRHRGDVTLRG